MQQVKNYSYRKTLLGESAVLKTAQLWLNPSQVTTIDSTTKSPSAPWWRIQCSDGSEFWTDRHGAFGLAGVGDPLGADPRLDELEKEVAVLKGRVDGLEAKAGSLTGLINRYQWSQSPWAGVQARLLSPNFIVHTHEVVFIEEVAGGYWKVGLTDDSRHYTDGVGAAILGVVFP